uniref:Putative nonstructural protein n=1 Tax=Calhevirus 3 TaxID=2219047 RepID=A0A2Z4BSS4_9VIRU|nr:MAG: putative nonstructural protein [Calhevirus 3]
MWCARSINDMYYPLYTRMLADFAPSTAIAIENFIDYVIKTLSYSRQRAQLTCRALYMAAHDSGIVEILVNEDTGRTPFEIVTDVVTNPVRELRAFLQSLACSADNAYALFDVSKVDLIDPSSNKRTTPSRILSRATYNFISSLAHRSASDVASIFGIVLGIIASKNSYTAMGATLLSSIALIMNPTTSVMFTARKAALYNLSRMVNLRQTTRFALFAAILLFAWKTSKKVFGSIMALFRMSPVEEHASTSAITSIVTVILGVLITWLTGHYKASFVVDFLRTSSLIGGSNFVFNTLNDCIVFVTRLISDFATWVGFHKLSQPLNTFLAKKTLDTYTRRGGELSDLLPRVSSFLAARPIGYSGPGTQAFVEEGRSLIHKLDGCIKDVTAVDGAGHVLNSLTRMRLNVTAAIETSLFTMENSAERCEPLFVLFSGGPRMGKTMFVNALISALKMRFAAMEGADGQMRQTSILAQENRWIYSRNTDDQFFSGYNKQCLIFYDDLFTANNSKESTPAGQRHELELSEIQKLVSSQPYAPPTPEVGAGVPCPKGTYINPAFVVATSNFALANSGCRGTDVIDDRIGELILVTVDPNAPKDSSFAHLRFWRLITKVSRYRDLCDARGAWQHPYGIEKQFPYTHDEFNAWKMRDQFQEVNARELLDIFVEGHERRLVELQIRRQGASNIVIGEQHDTIDNLETSYRAICDRYDLQPVSNFRARCMAYGLVKTLEGTRTFDGNRLRIDPEGAIRFHLVEGVLTTESPARERVCTCPGGHVSMVTCPDFDQLIITFAYASSRDASPVKPVPPYIVFGSNIVRSQTPIPTHVPFWETVFQSLASAYGGLPPISMERFGDPIDLNYGGVAPVVIDGLVRGLACVFPEVAEVAYVNQDGMVRKCGRTLVREPVAMEPHSLQWNCGDILRHVMEMRTKSDAPEPTQEEIDAVVWACAQIYVNPKVKLDRKLADKLRSDMEFMQRTNIPTETNPTWNMIWLVNLRDTVTESCQRQNITIPRFSEMLESEFFTFYALSSMYYGYFAWRYLSHMLLQAIINRYEINCPLYVQLTRRNDDVVIVQIKHHDFPDSYVMCREVGGAPFDMQLITYQLRDACNMSQTQIMENLTEIGSLVSFADALIGVDELTWFEKLKTAMTSMWELLRVNSKTVITCLAAAAGALAVGAAGMILADVFMKRNKHVIVEHTNPFHRPRPEKVTNWPDCYQRLILLCEHPNASLTRDSKGRPFCKLCSNFSKVTHSNWDTKKEETIVHELYKRNKKHPNLKNYLLAMLRFNERCLPLLQSNDGAYVQRSLYDLASEHKVPYTASGMTRHLYVFRAWNCMCTREKALVSIRAQSDVIRSYLGNFHGEPMYQVQLDFIRSCEIPSEPVECCPEIGNCKHYQEHAYYLPDSTVKFSATDKAIAVASSGMGFLMSDGMVRGRGAIIGDGVIITAAHVVRSSIESETEWYWRGQTKFTFFLNRMNVVIVPETDIALIKVQGDELPAATYENIWSCDKPTPGTKVSLISLSHDLRKTPIVATVLSRKIAAMTEHYFIVDKAMEPGDSGSLVIQGGRIVGHYNGMLDGKYGIVCHWPTSTLKAVKCLRRSNLFDSRYVQYLDEEHGFAILDEFDTREADSSPPSAERKTELFDAFESMGIKSAKFPASQSLEALTNSFEKFSHVTENFCADYAIAADELASHFKTQILLEHGELQPFHTWDEAINGRAQGESRKLKKIDTSTSAGAPWCDHGVDKRYFIDDGNHDWLKCKPNLVKLMDEVEAKFKSGDVAGFTATANNKDELRDPDRVKQKKTRLFCATPMHHNIMFRKYYGRWIAAFKSLDFRNGMHAMGSDVFGDDWNNLYNYLMSPPSDNPKYSKPVFLAGDFSRFDTSHSGWKMNLAFKVAAACNADQDMSEILARSISRFAVRFRDREFKVPAGLPSGCQMTTPINCILNTLLWVTVWRRLTGHNLASFMENCRLVVYGDDVVLGIDAHNPYFKFLTPQRIQQVMKDLGYGLESADNKELRWQTIDEVTFLKRRFIVDTVSPNLVHAPRPLEEVYTQLMWRRSEPTLAAQQCCFYAFAAEVGQYPPEVQQKVYRRLLEAIKRSKSALMKEAISTISFEAMMDRAWKKQLLLEDVARFRGMFWKLW